MGKIVFHEKNEIVRTGYTEEGMAWYNDANQVPVSNKSIYIGGDAYVSVY